MFGYTIIHKSIKIHIQQYTETTKCNSTIYCYNYGKILLILNLKGGVTEWSIVPVLKTGVSFKRP